jgi:CxxC motif-containing protein (DUF1111 family)
MRARLVLPLAFLLLVAASCVGKELPAPAALPSRPVDPRSGGFTTIYKAGPDAYSFSARNLSRVESIEFSDGTSYFNDPWSPPENDTTGGERVGLGPLANDDSCLGCHIRHGRGLPPDGEIEGDDSGVDGLGPPTTGLMTTVPGNTVADTSAPSSTTTVPQALADAAGEPRIEDDSTIVAGRGFLLKLSVPGAGPHGEPLPEPTYGTQFQTESASGVVPEGQVRVTYVIKTGYYGDLTRYTLLVPTYEVTDLGYGPMAPDVQVSPRVAPPAFGAGLLEAIPAPDVLAGADPDDRDGDGIRGRANLVWDPLTSSVALGRFGAKAGQASVHTQVVSALSQDLGVTSAEVPTSACTVFQVACTAVAARSSAPEATDEAVSLLTFYSRTLAVPAARDTHRTDVTWGAHLFDDFGCASCHRPTWVTGADPVAGLAGQTIHPYTDLLVHDLGPGLADDRPEFSATGRDWRTTPLWGIGLADRVAAGKARFLHDGRARTLAEAVLWHGGEAQTASDAFRTARPDERAALIRFLQAL